MKKLPKTLTIDRDVGYVINLVNSHEICLVCNRAAKVDHKGHYLWPGSSHILIKLPKTLAIAIIYFPTVTGLFIMN